MKVKMVKMGMDIDENRNHRIRGIIPTKENEYLFIEILQGKRFDRKNTSLSQKDYELKYPNQEYIWIDFCFRVDIPKEHYDNYSPKFNKYQKNSFYELAHTKENIIKLLKRLNPEIDDIELVDDYYIDKFCEEKGFFKLYDDRLKHKKEFIDIRWLDPKLKGNMGFNYKYICYAANGTEYSEMIETNGKIEDIILEYGKENLKTFIDKYIKEVCDNDKYSDNIRTAYTELQNDIFNFNKINLEIEDEYTDI